MSYASIAPSDVHRGQDSRQPSQRGSMFMMEKPTEDRATERRKTLPGFLIGNISSFKTLSQRTSLAAIAAEHARDSMVSVASDDTQNGSVDSGVSSTRFSAHSVIHDQPRKKPDALPKKASATAAKPFRSWLRRKSDAKEHPNQKTTAKMSTSSKSVVSHPKKSHAKEHPNQKTTAKMSTSSKSVVSHPKKSHAEASKAGPDHHHHGPGFHHDFGHHHAYHQRGSDDESHRLSIKSVTHPLDQFQPYKAPEPQVHTTHYHSEHRHSHYQESQDGPHPRRQSIAEEIPTPSTVRVRRGSDAPPPAWRRKKPRVLNRTEEEKYMQQLGSTYRQASYLERHTHFDSEEIRALMEIYKKCGKGKTWDRAVFRDIMIECFGMFNDEMLDRMFSFFDSDHEGTVTETEFVQNLSILLRGSLDEHINYCYEIYDFNGDQGISREELNHLFRGCLINIPSDEDATDNIREIVELALRKLDEHRTGVVTRESFRAAVLRDPLLLQALGPCLPQEKNVRGFLHLFSDNPARFSMSYSKPGDPGFNHRPKHRRRQTNMGLAAHL